MLPGDKIGNHLHRPRTVCRNESNNIFYTVGFEIDQQILHPGTFQLEDTVCFTFDQQLVCFGVIRWQVIDIKIDMMRFFDEIQSVFDDGQRLETQKVKLC